MACKVVYTSYTRYGIAIEIIMDNDKKEKFLKKLVERTLKFDAERKSEQQKQAELEDHISALGKMTNLDKSKIKEIANTIILEDEDAYYRQKKSSPTSKSKYAIAIGLLIFVAVIIQILNPTANESAPETVAIQPDNIASAIAITPTITNITPIAELPKPKVIEYEITKVEKKAPKIRIITMGTTKTWGDDLNPRNEMPLNSFKAFYINTNNRKRVIATSHVKQVAIKYSYKDLHNIDSKDFGAYWVGLFEFTEDQELQFNVHLSWASTRIIVDGFVVYEGGSKGKIPYLFTEGKHKIEIEYTNNWHTTNFRAFLEEKT